MKLKQLAEKCGFDCVFGAKLDWDKQDEWQRQANGYRCTLKYQGRQYGFDFWQGVGISRDPEPEGCLDCLLSDAQGGVTTFDHFCGDFGYDTDSRKAEKIWKQCKKTAQRIRNLMGDDYETFLYAERD